MAMRSRTVSIVIAGSLILAGAAATAATVLQKSRFKGKFAFAVCRVSEPITCADEFPGQINTSFFVEGAEAVTRTFESPDETYNLVSATIVQENTCTGELDARFGQAADGFKARGLTSADIQGNLTLETFEGEPAGTLDVDLDVTGFGDTRTDGDHIRFDFDTGEGQLFISIKFTERSRSATAAGTLVLDGNEVPCTFDEGGIVDTKSGDRQTLR